MSVRDETFIRGWRARSAAGVIALIAGLALSLDVAARLAFTSSIGAACWSAMRYFTVIANILLMVTLSGVAMGSKLANRPARVGGAVLATLVAGLAYQGLLHDLGQLEGAAKTANILMHQVTPLLAAMFWLGFAPKGRLDRGDPIEWATLLLLYFLYITSRAIGDGILPYAFMDARNAGRTAALLNSLLVVVGFGAAGYALLWLDRRLANPAIAGGARSGCPDTVH